jgi:hypothetical protein
MSFAMPTQRRRGRIAFWVLAGLALLVSHDAIFLAQIGPGAPLLRVLRAGGHEYWSTASMLIGAAALMAGIATVIRLVRLRRRAASLHATTRAAHPARRVLTAWAALLAIVAIGFVLQENIEHFLAHGHVIGLGALAGPEYPLAIPVIGLVTAVAGLFAGALGGAEASLREAIAVALAALARRPERQLTWPSSIVARPHIPILARSGAGRAPPAMPVLT